MYILFLDELILNYIFFLPNNCWILGTNHKHVCGMEEDTCVNYVIGCIFKYYTILYFEFTERTRFNSNYRNKNYFI